MKTYFKQTDKLLKPYELSEIKEALINSCIKQNPKEFIPFLLSEKVDADMPNKIRFYRVFKHMINCGKQNSVGKWTLKIEKIIWIGKREALSYNFYDGTHKCARLSIIVIERNDKILIDTMPF